MNGSVWESWIGLGVPERESLAALGILFFVSAFSGSLKARDLPFLLLSFLGVTWAVMSGNPWTTLVGLGLTLLARAMDAIRETKKTATRTDRALRREAISVAGLFLAGAGTAWSEAGGDGGTALAATGLLLTSAPFPFQDWSLGIESDPYHRRAFWQCIFPLSAAWIALSRLEVATGFFAHSPIALTLVGILALLHSWLAHFREGGAGPSWILIPTTAFWVFSYALGAGTAEAAASGWTGFLLAASAITLWGEGIEQGKTLAPKSTTARDFFWGFALAAGAGLPLFLGGYGASITAHGWESGNVAAIGWVLIRFSFAMVLTRFVLGMRDAGNLVPRGKPLVGAILLLLFGVLWIWKGSPFGIPFLPLWGEADALAFPPESGFFISLGAMLLGVLLGFFLRNSSGPSFLRTGAGAARLGNIPLRGFHAALRSIEWGLEEQLWGKFIFRGTHGAFHRISALLFTIGGTLSKTATRLLYAGGSVSARAATRLRAKDPQIALVFGCAWLALLFFWIWKG